MALGALDLLLEAGENTLDVVKLTADGKDLGPEVDCLLLHVPACGLGERLAENVAHNYLVVAVVGFDHVRDVVGVQNKHGLCAKLCWLVQKGRNPLVELKLLRALVHVDVARHAPLGVKRILDPVRRPGSQQPFCKVFFFLACSICRRAPGHPGREGKLVQDNLRGDDALQDNVDFVQGKAARHRHHVPLQISHQPGAVCSHINILNLPTRPRASAYREASARRRCEDLPRRHENAGRNHAPYLPKRSAAGRCADRLFRARQSVAAVKPPFATSAPSLLATRQPCRAALLLRRGGRVDTRGGGERARQLRPGAPACGPRRLQGGTRGLWRWHQCDQMGRLAPELAGVEEGRAGPEQPVGEGHARHLCR